jgi:ABC-type multidrug transport system permease subunit
MSSLTRSVARKPSKPAAPITKAAPVTPMTDAERKVLKARFFRVMAITVACCFAAFLGMVGNVSMHQWWGLPLFVLAMIGGFGAQILFILGLVKANRTDKGA